MTFVLLFPGQGSQKPGMAQDLSESYLAAREVLMRGDESLGVSMTSLLFNGPESDLTLTQNAQPALFLHGAALFAVLRDRLAKRVVAAAGHSLGEFTAYHAAGSLTLERGVRLVRRRGELMYESGVQRPGAMAAVLGAVEGGIEALCERATVESDLVVPANFNNAVQVVVSGTVAGVEKLMELAKEAGARRVVRLNVSGAFHSPLMESAAEGLELALDVAEMVDPDYPVWSNVTGNPVSSAAEARALLRQQLTSPVRWEQLIQRMTAQHPDARYLELGPGNVLTGLVRRIAPGVQVGTCGTAAEAEALLSELD
ncbi:MAG TPA: ACP S-malonyltransferase [Gemmatimonadales bacterium]|nr:ACP S-malonyltransferase [Gemmatimonadales bacterium]